MKRASSADRVLQSKSFRVRRLAISGGAYGAYAEFLTETLAFKMHAPVRAAL
jgi:hypothetical protein